jgi:putative phage-type endonuclease
MERIAHDLVQGTPEWLAFRAEHDGASEAAAMLGLSQYMTRAELMKQKATGIKPEVDENTQRLFNAGHAAEAEARSMAEEIIAEELFQATYSYGRMSASTDGLSMDNGTALEHKLWNADLAATVARGELPDAYQPQCQQIMMVTGAEQVLFMVSDGTPENCVHMFVQPDPEWQKRIADGWKQFHADLAEYTYAEVLPAATAAPTMQLPALTIQINGSISVIDNLKMFGERLAAFIDGLDKNPSTDQSFADSEAAIKALGAAETALEAAKASALAQVASVDDLTRTVALYAGQARTTRLMLTKLVATRKETIRVDIVQSGRDALANHVAGLNKRIGKAYMPMIPADWASVIKGRKTVASLKDAVAGELARVKIEANAVADKISVNMAALRDMASAHAFLFSDAATIVQKETDDLIALVKMRIAEHAQAENKRIEAEREKIRAEEAEKLRRAQEDAQRKAEGERLAQEARERMEAEVQERAKMNAAVQGRTDTAAGEAIATTTTPAGTAPAAANEAAQSAPIPITGGRGGYVRPSETAILAVLCVHFGAAESEVRQWLMEMFSDDAVAKLPAAKGKR